MKKYLLFLLLLTSLSAPAQYAPPTGNAQAVTVDKTTGILIKPSNFANANGLATTNSAPANVVGLRKSAGAAVTDTAASSTDLQAIIGVHIYQPWSSTLTTLASGSPITAGSNVTVAGTWPNITINAANQVQADWNASSGIGVILNKPTIPTVPAYGTTAGTIAQGNDSRITGALQTSTLGSGVQAVLGVTPNSAGGLVTVNSSGSAASNVNFAKPGFLLLGNKGGFITGKERAVLCYSTDGVNFAHVPGADRITPHVTGDGFRDPTIIKSGTKYLAAFLCSKSGGIENYFEVQSSNDLVNWTFVADVTGAAGNSPKWFLDPPTGNLYLIISGGGSAQVIQNTSTTGGYPDGVSWGSPVTLSFAGSTTMADSCMVYRNGMYYLFYVQHSPSAFGQYYATSSSLLTGYAQIGAISIWQQGEGISIATTPQGTYRAYWHAMTGSSLSGNQTSTSSDLITWSTPMTIAGMATADATNAFDNAGIWCFSDADTWHDVDAAMAQGFSRLIQIDSSTTLAGYINTSAQHGFTGGYIDTSASQVAAGGNIKTFGGTLTGGAGGGIATVGGTSGPGGNIYTFGAGTRSGGNLVTNASTSANGGSVDTSATSSGQPGSIKTTAQNSGNGGNIFAYSVSTFNAGNIQAYAGSAANGGSINCYGGTSSGASGGSISLFGTTVPGGSITLSNSVNTLTTSGLAQYTLTIPATQTDTFAMLGATQTITGNKTFSGQLILPPGTPASASASGTAGQIVWDSSYIYICTSTNTWKRVGIAAW